MREIWNEPESGMTFDEWRRDLLSRCPPPGSKRGPVGRLWSPWVANYGGSWTVYGFLVSVPVER